MQKDLLYVCNLSQAIRLNRSVPGAFHYLCICDCFTDEDDTELLANTVIINEKRSVSWLFNLVQDQLLRLAGCRQPSSAAATTRS